jgi:hypothetical protein
MQAFVGRLREDEIEAVALYYASGAGQDAATPVARGR